MNLYKQYGEYVNTCKQCNSAFVSYETWLSDDDDLFKAEQQQNQSILNAELNNREC